MDHDEGQKYAINGPVFMGAIFMSNRKTKQECLQRKLFGLPVSQAGFLKNVKAGMLLFLFEYEERKLYGVFEATSDGAMNIMPDAFSSSGMSFPAQILFKRIWFCKPLTEDEFRDAIKDNYYKFNKFNFGLSHKQVSSLVHMFSLKKISLERNVIPHIPNRVIQAYENSDFDKVRVPNKGRVKRSHSDVSKTDSGIDSSRCPGYFPRDIDQSVYDQGRALTSSRPIFDANPQPNLMHSTFQDDLVPRKISPVGQCRGSSDYHIGQESGLERCSRSFDMQPSLAEEHADYSKSQLDSIDPFFGNQLRPQHPNFKLSDSPATDYQSPDVSRTQLLPSHSNYKLSNLRSTNYQNLDAFRSHGMYGDSSFCPTMPLHASLTFRASESRHNLREYKESPLLECHNPCPTTPLLTQGVTRNQGSTSSSTMYSPSTDFYIPSSKENYLVGKIPPCHLPSSPLKNVLDEKYRYNSESEEENEELNQKLIMDDEYYPMPVSPNSKLHSDIDQRRTSVFSRLSRGPDPCRQYEATHKQETGPSLQQLLEMISERRDQLSMNTEAVELRSRRDQWTSMNTQVVEPRSSRDQWSMNTQVVEDGRDQWCINSQVVEPIQVIQVLNKQTLEEIEMEQSEAITDETSELPFLNFKRRGLPNMENGTETSPRGVNGEDEGKCKRRRLVRPSFTEEECPYLQHLSQESAVDENAHSSPSKTESARESPADNNAHNSPSKTDSAQESPVGKNAHISPSKTESAQESVDSSEASLAIVGNTAIPLDNSQGSKDCRNSVSVATPRWVFLKSIAAQAHKLSGIGDPKSKKHGTSNAPQVVSSCKASSLPVQSKCRDSLESPIQKNDAELVEFLPLELE